MNDFWFRKEFNFWISSGMKTLSIDSVFSNSVNVIKKAPIIIVLEYQRAERASIFLFEIRMLRFFQQTQCFFFCLLAFIIFFLLLVCYVLSVSKFSEISYIDRVLFLKNNERSEDSYIGLAVFFRKMS